MRFFFLLREISPSPGTAARSTEGRVVRRTGGRARTSAAGARKPISRCGRVVERRRIVVGKRKPIGLKKKKIVLLKQTKKNNNNIKNNRYGWEGIPSDVRLVVRVVNYLIFRIKKKNCTSYAIK